MLQDSSKVCSYANLLREATTTTTENKKQSIYTKERSAQLPPQETGGSATTEFKQEPKCSGAGGMAWQKNPCKEEEVNKTQLK